MCASSIGCAPNCETEYHLTRPRPSVSGSSPSRSAPLRSSAQIDLDAESTRPGFLIDVAGQRNIAHATPRVAKEHLFSYLLGEAFAPDPNDPAGFLLGLLTGGSRLLELLAEARVGLDSGSPEDAALAGAGDAVSRVLHQVTVLQAFTETQ